MGFIASALTATSDYQAKQSNAATDSSMNNLNQANQGLSNIAANGSTLAQNQLQQATGQGIANATGAVANTKGLNPALAARMAGQNAGAAMQNSANQSAQLQAQTQMGALGQLQSGALSQYGTAQGGLNNSNTTDANTANANAAAVNATTGSLMKGAAGAATMMSDENQKTDIHNADSETQKFLDSMGAHSYEYKDNSLPGTGSGEHVSPMAQELEKTQMGKGMVQNTPNGKMVDYGKGFGAMAAALAYLNKKVDSMGGESKMAHGGVVAGKAQVDGNSPSNDTVPTMLSPGEAVIPRTAMESAAKAQAFINHLMAQKNQPTGYSKVLASKKRK